MTDGGGWNAAVLEIECPQCRARAGQKCGAQLGNRYQAPCRARVKKAAGEEYTVRLSRKELFEKLYPPHILNEKCDHCYANPGDTCGVSLTRVASSRTRRKVGLRPPHDRRVKAAEAKLKGEKK